GNRRLTWMRRGRSRLVRVAAFVLQTASTRTMRNFWQQWTCERRQHYEELRSCFALFLALSRPAAHFAPLRAPGGRVLEPELHGDHARPDHPDQAGESPGMDRA